MKSDSILTKGGVTLLYLPAVANPPYKHIEFPEVIFWSSFLGVLSCSPLCVVELSKLKVL